MLKPAPIFAKRYVHCPSCPTGQFAVEHLLREWKNGSAVGPWSCHDCGARSRFELRGQELFVEVLDQASTKQTVTLEIPENSPAIRFLIHAWRCPDERNTLTDEEYLEHQRYYYESHTCPVNWLQRVCDVSRLEDGRFIEDPHDIAKLVSIQKGHLTQVGSPDHSYGSHVRSVSVCDEHDDCKLDAGLALACLKRRGART